jgi:L-amino acid N-acyltransferase YncA
MQHFKKKIGLKDGKELIVRRPTLENDLEKMIDFLDGLPEERKRYLRYNIADRNICKTRLRQNDWVDHWRLVAEFNDEIVGSGTLDREQYGWTRHLARLRCVVKPSFSKIGVGPILFQQLVEIGSNAGIERLYAEVIKEQTNVITMHEKEGFIPEMTWPKCAKDQAGNLHDVIIMSNDLNAVWERLAQTVEDLDIRYSRLYSGL